MSELTQKQKDKLHSRAQQRAKTALVQAYKQDYDRFYRSALAKVYKEEGLDYKQDYRVSSYL